jgi:hypothetical protein
MMVITNTSFGQDTTTSKPSAPAKVRPYKDVITAQAVTSQGLFSVHKVDDKYYFEIPDSLLKREVLFTTRLVKSANRQSSLWWRNCKQHYCFV